jgi:hypothetical protein
MLRFLVDHQEKKENFDPGDLLVMVQTRIRYTTYNTDLDFKLLQHRLNDQTQMNNIVIKQIINFLTQYYKP